MKNKKRNLIIFSTLLVIVVGVYLLIPKTKEEIEDTETKVNTNGFLTLMLEQDDGSYQKSSSSLWPETGYIFNDVLSNCENGSELIWNDELKTITLKTNKSDKCYVYFDKYINPVVNNVTVTDTSTSSISISVSASGGTNNVATYYYSINNGSYTSSTSNTKTFTGLSKGTTYTIKVYVKDTNGVDSSVYTISAETENIILLADYIKGLYTSQGSNGLYYHTSSLANSAADNSYRYAGANPNNYVCFGSTASKCPSDNLYRIIGVFGSEVKLIKADYTTTTMTGSGGDYYRAYHDSISNYKGSMNTSNIASYRWNYSNGESSTNTWSESRLNTTNLNSSYLSYIDIGTTWSNKIVTHTWYVGGYSTESATPKTWYNAESSGTTYSAKIGLMYVSDYGYAASNSYWTTNISSYSSASNNNWMHMGLYEWTISRASFIDSVLVVLNTGELYIYSVCFSDFAVRPVFYLTSSTTYVSGSGTSSDPIRIN